MSVAIGTLGWVLALTIASRDLAWVLVLFSFCRDTLHRDVERVKAEEREVQGTLLGPK